MHCHSLIYMPAFKAQSTFFIFCQNLKVTSMALKDYQQELSAVQLVYQSFAGAGCQSVATDLHKINKH
jgi:hypothetical protein